MLRKTLQTLVFTAAMIASAQAPASNPPATPEESAVRERVSAFYALQQDGKFRQAEAFVCDDSKDRFYNARKRKWINVQVMGVRFVDEPIRTAMVTTALSTKQNTPAGVIDVTYPITSYWRVENAAWCMHLPEPSADGSASPFGKMHAPTTGEASTAPLKYDPVDPALVMGGVKLSKSTLVLAATGESSDELEITNGLRGRVELELIPIHMDGLTVTLSHKDLKAGEKATLKLAFKSVDSNRRYPLNTVLMVHPLNRKFPITVRFEAAAAKK